MNILHKSEWQLVTCIASMEQSSSILPAEALSGTYLDIKEAIKLAI